MYKEEVCPYCDELVEFDVTDDYAEVEQNNEIEITECPKCHKQVSVSWRVIHKFDFNKSGLYDE